MRNSGNHQVHVAAAVVVAVAGVVLGGCSGNDDASSERTTTSVPAAVAELDATLAAEVIEHYADGVYASYDRSVESATALSSAVESFLAGPTDATMTAARDAWLAARPHYGLTEAYRFYGGPIDDEETGPEGQINGWPMDEAYVDYVEGDPSAGIIADTAGFPTLDAAVLAEANEAGGETNLSTGWHAIEFLLWGQDLSVDGPGARPVTDYTTDANAARRAEYLRSVTGLLVTQLTEVRDAWAPDADNYRAGFTAQPATEALTAIITGIGELSRGELAGERMTVAYEARSQEDEHSCFSDNTLADIAANAGGIRAVWTGEYVGPGDTPLSGPGIEELVASLDEDLAQEATAAISASTDSVGEIPAPFDQHLTADAPDDGPGRTAILATIELLGAQTDLIVEAATALGVRIEVS